MRKTYIDFICELLKDKETGVPIYTNHISEAMAAYYEINSKESAAAVSVAIKRIMDGKLLPELRYYQKGIYYLTTVTPFGEVNINKEQLIADKYLLPDIGYETGLTVLHQIGLTTQMPKERLLATNIAKECTRTDKKLGVTIRPPKARITAENKAYLQTLDILELIDKSPIDEEQPYVVMANHIRENKLQYSSLLALADSYYSKATILRLAHTASAGGIRI